jgi:mono/diheme cytochrome c family protein
MKARILLISTAWFTTAIVTPAQTLAVGQVTFHKDILPVLQKNCQGCHRPGQIAPMSFLAYEGTRPWAKAIKAAVLSKKMPPWNADPAVGHFTNDRSLKPAEVELITKWVDAGAPAGDSKDAPSPVDWPDNGWQIHPDVVVKGVPYNVPAGGLVEWTWVVLPSPFKEDTWVTSIEVKPTQVPVTHHICLALGPHKPTTEYYKFVWQDRQRDANGDEIDDRKQPRGGFTAESLAKNPVFGILAGTSGIEECYEPGRGAADFRPYKAAKLIPAGTDIAVNVHYTPSGQAITANFEIGFTVTKTPPERKYLALSASAPQDHEHFAIPANEPDWPAPPVDIEFTKDVELVGLMPHMHVRGKAASFELTYPDGRKEMILNVPKYDFNWQIWYDTSLSIPKGTKMRVIARYDNSVNNKYNPNPNKVVYYGDMTWDEMHFPSWGVIVNDKSLTQHDVVRAVRDSQIIASR